MNLAKRCVAGLAVILLATQAFAQPTPLPYETYVETHRPKMAIRTLSPDEEAQAKAAIKAWSKEKTEANLLAVKPWAETGHPDALETMVEGYQRLQKSTKDRSPQTTAMAKPENGLIPLTGLWAMHAWQQAGWSKTYGKAAELCLKIAEYDCGMDIDSKTRSLLQAKLDGKISAYAEVLFTERPVRSEQAVKMARLETDLGKWLWAFRESRGYGLPLDEQKWMLDFVASNAEAKAAHDAAQFKNYIWAAGSGNERRVNTAWVNAYIAGDPERQRQYALASIYYRQETAQAAARFNSDLAQASTLQQLESLRETAWREGGQKAADLWAKLRAVGGISRIDTHRFCQAGAKQACADAQFVADTDARAAQRQQAAQAAGVSGLASPEDITQALKDQNKRVNAENCARADLGASIACKRD